MSVKYFLETIPFESIASLPTDLLFERYKILSDAVVRNKDNSLPESTAWALKAHFAEVVRVVNMRVRELPMNIVLCYATNPHDKASDVENRPDFCLTIKEICMKEILRRYFRDSICNSGKK